MHLRRLIAAALFALLTVLGQAAEQFPARQITLVVPLTPGTAIDIQARLYADGLAKRFGYKVVVVNRAGAGTLIGADLTNLDKVSGLGAPVASIGGAGTFDGIFLTGILAVLLASLYARPRAAPAG